MNILILADAYTRPSFAPRLRYLCDYLVEQRHTIEVYTEKWNTIPFEHDYPIHELNFYHLGPISWAIKTLYSILTDWKERSFARRILWRTRNQKFDLVFCTTFSTFPLGAALRVARSKRLPLHVDIRDVEEQAPGHAYVNHPQWYLRPFASLYSHIMRKRRDAVLRAADSITTVSPWHVDFLRRYNPNVHLIYNGFDPAVYYPQDITTDTFRIDYIGRLYDFQNIDYILRAIKDLHSQIPEMQVTFYTNGSAYERLAYCHISTHGFIPLNAVGDAIRRSSILLVFSNPETNGVMTTKFYEALGCEKPVLCTPSDKGILADTIHFTNAGLASSDLKEIKAFILDKYAEWKHQGFTRQAVSNKDQFNRYIQAQEFENLLRHITGL